MPPSPIVLSLAVSVGIHAVVLFYATLYQPLVAHAIGRANQVLEVKLQPATERKTEEELNSRAAILSGDEIFTKNEETKNSRRGESVTGGGQACPYPYDYLSGSEVDVKPVPKKQINRNPTELIRYREGGLVDAELCIEADGTVSRVIVTRTTLPKAFEIDVVDQFSQQYFRPAEKNGRLVPVRLKISVKYQQQSSAAAVEKIPLAGH